MIGAWQSPLCDVPFSAIGLAQFWILTQMSCDQPTRFGGQDCAEQILANARSLMLDARLLAQHERYSSAVALAVLSLEEFGKYLIRIWDSSKRKRADGNKRNYHRAKQEAVCALYMAAKMQESLQQRAVGSKKPEIVLEAFIDALNVPAPYFSVPFFDMLNMNAMNLVKECSLYYDVDRANEGLSPSIFGHKDAHEMLQLCDRVNALLDSGEVVETAEAFLVFVHQNTPA